MKLLRSALICCLVGVVAVALLYPPVLIRYRLTIETEFNGQPRSGSGVIQVEYRRNIQILGASAVKMTSVTGNAVSVDLGAGDVLFALLTAGPLSARSGPDDIIPNLFGVVKGGFGPEAFSRISAIEGGREVPLELLPLMVRLRDTNNPKSAILFVPPGGQPPNQNFILKRAVIEIVSPGVWPINQFGITGEPITQGIELKLPWLEGFTGYTGGQPEPIWSQPEKNLTGIEFIKGASR